jgi:hypothetical protein
MMTPAEIDRAASFALLSFVLGGICWFFGLAISTLMFVGLGAMGRSFTDWRSEHGLWMLGALFFLIFGGLFATFTFFQIADWVAGRVPLGWWLAFDWFIGTSVLSYMVRFLWAVTHWNRQIHADA